MCSFGEEICKRYQPQGTSGLVCDHFCRTSFPAQMLTCEHYSKCSAKPQAAKSSLARREFDLSYTDRAKDDDEHSSSWYDSRPNSASNAAKATK
jgi:hypothetical protein